MPAPRLRTDPAADVENLCVLLLQARNTPVMERQEQTCFLERGRLRTEQLRSVNLARRPLPPDALDEADALLIGGAGEYSAMDDPDWMPGLLDLVREAAERALPTLGSCWGHQVLARAFGGTLVHDSANAELGCRTIELTDAGRADPLFADCPPRFKVNTGHHDRVTRLPDGATELARNDQPYQAFRLDDLPVYGTQFHTELDAARERERLVTYRDYYRADLPDENDFQEVLRGLLDTGEADRLLHDFLCRFAAA